MSNFKIFSSGLVAIALSLASGCTPTTPHDQNISEVPPAVPVQTTESPSPTASPTDSPTISPTDSPTTSPTTSPTPSPTTSPTTRSQNTPSSSDKRFMTEAAQGGLAEVQLGQLASKRGTSKAVKQYGQRMVRDHTPVNNQLKKLAAKKGAKLPTGLDSTNQEVKNNLSKLNGAKFDREYLNQMLQDHQKDVSAFQTEAQQGQDPEVKAFAAKTLPTLQEHLRQVSSLVNSANSTNTPTPATTP